MMNPFDLPGPQFLALYAFFGVVVLALLYGAKRAAEAGEVGRVPMSDPYQIAYLRGGAAETVRLSAAVLIERQLLDVQENDLVETREGISPSHGANELERAILERCTRVAAARNLPDDPELQEQARRAYEPALLRLGLLAGPETHATRARLVTFAAAALAIVAAIKVAIGVSRNRPVSFLVIAAVTFMVLAALAIRGSRTASGDRLLRDLQVLFDDLRHRLGELRMRASSHELALFLAVFGIEALPMGAYPFVLALRPKPAFTPSASSASSCGSTYSCGSSSSGGGCGGGGSSCGGGGGGCGGGGCGGCGS